VFSHIAGVLWVTARMLLGLSEWWPGCDVVVFWVVVVSVVAGCQNVTLWLLGLPKHALLCGF